MTRSFAHNVTTAKVRHYKEFNYKASWEKIKHPIPIAAK